MKITGLATARIASRSVRIPEKIRTRAATTEGHQVLFPVKAHATIPITIIANTATTIFSWVGERVPASFFFFEAAKAAALAVSSIVGILPLSGAIFTESQRIKGIITIIKGIFAVIMVK